jgi:hypothetical protein
MKHKWLTQTCAQKNACAVVCTAATFRILFRQLNVVVDTRAQKKGHEVFFKKTGIL